MEKTVVANIDVHGNKEIIIYWCLVLLLSHEMELVLLLSDEMELVLLLSHEMEITYFDHF